MSRIFKSSQTGGNETYLLSPHSAVYDSQVKETIAAWIYPTAESTFNIILTKDQDNGPTMALLNGHLQGVGQDVSATGFGSESVATIPINTWTHVAMTFDFSGDKLVHLYINGTEVSYSSQNAAASGTPFNDSAQGFYIGNDTFDEGFDGSIAEVAIWNTVLSSGQLASLAASKTGAASIASGNLTAYWHILGAASPEPDSTANGNSAVVHGSPVPAPGADSPGFTNGGPTYVQSKIASSHVGNVSSISATFNSNNTLGNSIIVCVIGSNGGGPMPAGFSFNNPTDSQGNVYAPVAAAQLSDYGGPGGDQQLSQCFLATGIKALPNTVQVTENNADTADGFNMIMMAIIEVTGTAVFDKLAFGFRDPNGHGTSTSATALDSTATATMTQANEYVVGFGGDLTTGEGGSISFTVGSGCTSREFLNDDGTIVADGPAGIVMGLEDKNVSFAGAQEASYASNTNLEWQMSVYTFYAGASSLPTDKAHSADAYIIPPIDNSIHSADAYIQTYRGWTHGADVFINPASIFNFANLESLQIPPINPNAFARLKSNLAAPALQAVQLGTTLLVPARGFVQLGTLQASQIRSYAKLKTNLMLGGSWNHGADVVIATVPLGFVRLGTNLIQSLVADTECGGQFPDVSFLNLSTWLVQAGKSQQAPGTALLPIDDWQSQVDALGAYQTVGRFILDKIALIVTGFTTGVISYQTRTRQWLRRVDALPGGVVVSTAQSNRTLPNGQKINTTTTTTQVQDLTIVETVTTYSTSPRITKTITTTNKYGQQIRQEIETDTTGQHTTEKKIVSSAPPTTENVQPITVTTLDGVKHYQFFGAINPNWAGGDAEGTTVTDTQVSESGDTKHTVSVVNTPDGKTITTTTDEIGAPGVGTSTANTSESWNGLQKTVNVVTMNPDGTQTVKNTVTNLVTGDIIETTVEALTDENGLVTTTTTVVETVVTNSGPGGIPVQTITTTKTVQGPAGTTTETDTSTNNNFEDDIISQKIKVYFVQEFTINCIIDRFSMEALLEIQIGHQKNFAIVELIGQQLGNANLSWALRQNLINQFNQAMACIASIQLQALGKTYNVVFAPSAASFRAKYIPGTMPAVFELQMIVQERSDLVTGLTGF